MDNKLKKLILGYDILFPYCEVPNCLDPKDLQFAKDCDYYYDNSQTYFKEKLNKEWYIHNGRFMVHLNDESGDPGYFAIDKKSTYDIIKDRERGKNYDWYYLIEAYGDFDNFLGLSKSNPQPFSEFIPSHTLNELKNYNGKLIINFAIDGGLSTLKVDKLYECLLNLNIPKEKIIILHNDFNLEKLMKPIFGEYMPTLIHYCWSLNSKSEEYFKKTHQDEFHFWHTDDRKTNYSFLTNDECKDLSKKTHKFLNLNRRLRIHRIDLLYFLWKENMLDDVLISYDSKLFTHDGMNMMRNKLSIEEWNDFYHYIVHTSPRIVDYYDIESIWGYGFETKEDLAWFELLLTVSGIGPKSALSIMNAVDTKALERAIAGNNPGALSSAFGVGKKTAEKIDEESKNKLIILGTMIVFFIWLMFILIASTLLFTK